MPEELPKFVDARRLAEQAGTITGVIAPVRLRRVVAPYAARHPVRVTLSVGMDDVRRPRITGRIKTEITATCQRCLGEMGIDIDRRIDVVVREAGNPIQGDDDGSVEVITIVDGKFDVKQFVEDEIVLACPMVPMHDNPGCNAWSNTDGRRGDERKKAFADLAELMSMAGKKDESGR